MYVKQTWFPDPSGANLIPADNLNYMEDGIQDASNRLDAVEATFVATNGSISDLASDVGTLQSQVDSIMLNGVASGGGGTTTPVPTTITKADIGLGNVDNTSDVLKPISNAVSAALATKAPLSNPSFTGTVTGITKSMVGLASVDNTPDISKPISTAQAAALALKAPLASPAFTGTVSGITKAMVGLSNVDNLSSGQLLANTGVMPVLYYDGAAWPPRVVPTGYVGAIKWNSEEDADAPEPPGAIDSDRWERKRILQ